MPVNGTSVETTAMFSRAWNTSQAVTPIASSEANGSVVRAAIRSPRTPRIRNTTSLGRFAAATGSCILTGWRPLANAVPPHGSLSGRAHCSVGAWQSTASAGRPRASTEAPFSTGRRERMS